jgi:hypothetical protein
VPLTESGKRKWNNLKFGTEETLAHLAFIKKKTEEEPETFKNFWPLALVRTLPGIPAWLWSGASREPTFW